MNSAQKVPQTPASRFSKRVRSRVVDSGSQPNALGSKDWLEDVVRAPEGVVGLIRDEVARNVVNGQLDGGERERLVRAAMSLGVSRFDANLILAAAMHRVGAAEQIRPARDANCRSRVKKFYGRASKWSTLQWVAAVLIVELVAVVGLISFLR